MDKGLGKLIFFFGNLLETVWKFAGNLHFWPTK